MMDLPIIKIVKEEDLEFLQLYEEFHLEIYLHACTIQLDHLKGNLIVRATHCLFPNLKIVDGLLSVDGKENVFPELHLIKGNLNIHEVNTRLPKLEKVLGKLKKYEEVLLPKLKIISGVGKENEWIEISNNSELQKVKDNQYCNLRIYDASYPLVFPFEEHFGSIEIINSSCSFSNLKKIWGDLLIKNNDKREVHTPKLKVILGRCEINSSNQRIRVDEIGKKLIIQKGMNNTFPSLYKVGSITLTKEGTELIAPQLRIIEKKSLLDGRFKAHLLEIINIEYSYDFEHYLPNLRVINGSIITPESAKNIHYLNNLTIVKGNYFTNDYLETPELTKVFGTLKLVDNTTKKFKNLKTISVLEGSKEAKENFVKINTTITNINKSEYFETDNPGIVKEFYHQIRENQLLSKNYFYLGSRWRNQKLPISFNMYVQILKMKHSSYQNFYTREVLREWTCEMNPHLITVLKKIERVWQEVEALSFQKLFKIENLNIRRFSFNYVGVAEVMKTLNASRIKSEGILVKHYEYDLEGNKTIVEKHNIFETYEVNFNQISDLRVWNRNLQKGYAVKCWCTSTNNEHWLWIENQYKDNPLEAIASTFRIHENVIPHIKHLKRQGDILLCEMKRKVIPEGEIRPLTKDEYFKLLIAES